MSVNFGDNPSVTTRVTSAKHPHTITGLRNALFELSELGVGPNWRVGVGADLNGWLVLTAERTAWRNVKKVETDGE